MVPHILIHLPLISTCHGHETTKVTRFFNQNENKDKLNFKTKQTRIKTRQMQIRIQQHFIAKKKQNKGMIRKRIQN